MIDEIINHPLKNSFLKCLSLLSSGEVVANKHRVLLVGGTASVWLGSHDNFFYRLWELNGIQKGLVYWVNDIEQDIYM